MKYRVLVVDRFDDKGMEVLRQDPEVELRVEPGATPEGLSEVIAPYHGLITRSQHAVKAALLERAASLRVLGRAGVGVDNIDLAAATRRGIMVLNTPEANIVSATEHTVALLLSLARKVPAADRMIKAGLWRREDLMGYELHGKTLGVIGLGRIGSRVALIAKGMKISVVAYDPYIPLKRGKELGVPLVDLPTLLSTSDFITVHTPLTVETRRMISRPQFDLMKDGVFLVNCARGGIYDEEALYDNLKGKVRGAALDVFENEPVKGHRLLELPNVIATPHIGANTFEAQARVAVELAQSFLQALRGKMVPNAVNLPFAWGDLSEKILPYMELAGKMGGFVSQYRSDPVLEVKVSAYGEIKEDAYPLLVCFIRGLLGRVLSEPVSYINAVARAQERGIRLQVALGEEDPNYKNYFRVEAGGADGTAISTISGTVFGGHHQRVIEIDGNYLEIKPEGVSLVVKNRDVPGVVGSVGVLLGDRGINIAEYRLGRKRENHEAFALIAVDSEVHEEVLEALRKLPQVLFARKVVF